MKALLAPALALGLLGAAASAGPAEAANVGIGIHIGSPGYHHGYSHDRGYWHARWHHRHRTRYCTGWGWRHHARYCRGWGWRWY